LNSKSLAKVGLGLVMSGIMIISLLAGCGGSSTVTETKTVTSGSGSASTVTATTTVTASGGSGAAMPNIVIYGDMVSNIGCLAITYGHRGELLVFRARIVDPKTGKDMTDKDVVKDSVKALLPDGQKFTMSYGGHGTPVSDTFWSGIWEVPLNYPTGSLGYEITATANDGRTGSFKPFQMASSNLTIKEFDVAFVRNWSVNITATGFSVQTVTCSQGAKVTFSNRDAIPHKVVGDGWDSGDIAGAVGTTYKTFVKTFDKAGTFVVKDGANSVTIVVNPTS
jgi:plastocyanin